MKQLTVSDRHQIKIAKQTLRLNDVGVMVLGGMDRATAREVLHRLAGWSHHRIANYESRETR